MAAIVAGRKYKLVNTVNQACIYIKAGSSNGAIVTASPWLRLANQVWKATDNGKNVHLFAVDNQPTPGVTYVLDASQKALGETCVYSSRDSANQLWSVEPIKPGAFLCYVKSMSDGRVLQYDGNDQKVHVAKLDTNNPKQHWTFEEQY